VRTSAPASPLACLHVRNPARSLNTPPPRALRPELIARSEYRGQSWASLPCLTAATYAWSAANTWSGSERGQRRGWGQGLGQGQGQGPKAWAKAWARVGVRVGSERFRGSGVGVRARARATTTSRISGSIWALQTPSLALCSSNAHVLQLRQPKVARRALDPVRVLVRVRVRLRVRVRVCVLSDEACGIGQTAWGRHWADGIGQTAWALGRTSCNDARMLAGVASSTAAILPTSASASLRKSPWNICARGRGWGRRPGRGAGCG